MLMGMARAPSPTRKKVGRPPKPPGEKWIYVATRLPPAELARLDAHVEPGQTRNEVLRELALEALEARAKKGRGR
jgi:hypothetical protein